MGDDERKYDWSIDPVDAAEVSPAPPIHPVDAWLAIARPLAEKWGLEIDDQAVARMRAHCDERITLADVDVMATREAWPPLRCLEHGKSSCVQCLEAAETFRYDPPDGGGPPCVYHGQPVRYWNGPDGKLHCRHGVILYGTSCIQCEREGQTTDG